MRLTDLGQIVISYFTPKVVFNKGLLPLVYAVHNDDNYI